MTTHCDVINAVLLDFTILINLQSGFEQCLVGRGFRKARKLGILWPHSGGQNILNILDFQFSSWAIQGRLLFLPEMSLSI